MLITISGKGGVGKTTLTALLVDELLRQQYPGRVLVIDADPASTLHFALGIPVPGATLAQVRDGTPLNAKAIKSLPTGVSPADFVRQRLFDDGVLVERSLRQRHIDYMAMGRREGGPGCYCAINSALSEALATIMGSYDLIIVDAEAGIEHLSRYRVRQVDLFLIATTAGHSAMAVAHQIEAVARQAGMQLGEVGVIVNRLPSGGTPPLTPGASQNSGIWGVPLLAVVSDCQQLTQFDLSGRAVVELPDDAAPRHALQPVIERIEALSNVRNLVP